MLCEGLKASVEEKPEVAGGLQMLGMDTNVICANRWNFSQGSGSREFSFSARIIFLSAQLKINLALVLMILLVNINAVIW